MADEFLEQYDRVLDWAEEIWDTTPLRVRVPALAVFWVAVAFGARNAGAMLRRFPNLNQIPQTYFMYKGNISVKVHYSPPDVFTKY